MAVLITMHSATAGDRSWYSVPQRALYGSIARLFDVSIVLLLLGGCTPETSGPRTVPITGAYWTLQLDQHAITLSVAAPTNTIQLHATPITVAGTPISGLGPVTYTASDTTVVVSSTGLVTAHTPNAGTGNLAYVVASLQDTAQNLTHTDTAFIQTTAAGPAAPLAIFSIQPGPGDSARVTQGAGRVTIPLHATDQQGNDISATLVTYFVTSDPTIGFLSSDQYSANPSFAVGMGAGDAAVHGLMPGTVMVTASTWWYGISRVDTLRYIIGEPIYRQIEVLFYVPFGQSKNAAYFQPGIVTIGVGGVVDWDNGQQNQIANPPIDIVFDQPEAAAPACAWADCIDMTTSGSGNIAPFAWDPTLNTSDWASVASGNRARTFTIPGTYRYHSSLYGVGGTIVVR